MQFLLGLVFLHKEQSSCREVCVYKSLANAILIWAVDNLSIIDLIILTTYQILPVFFPKSTTTTEALHEVTESKSEKSIDEVILKGNLNKN